MDAILDYEIIGNIVRCREKAPFSVLYKEKRLMSELIGKSINLLVE
jgi:hypothetical protein